MEKETTLFEDLMEGLGEMRKHLKGEASQVRVTVLSRPEPLSIQSDEIKAIRHQLKLSQSVFASKLRTSVRTYQGWEQGKSKPNAQAILLLRMVEKSPQLFQQIAQI